MIENNHTFLILHIFQSGAAAAWDPLGSGGPKSHPNQGTIIRLVISDLWSSALALKAGLKQVGKPAQGENAAGSISRRDESDHERVLCP